MKEAAPPRAGPWLRALAALFAVAAFALGLLGFFFLQPASLRPLRPLAWRPPPADGGTLEPGERVAIDGGVLEFAQTLPLENEALVPGDPVVAGPRGWLALPNDFTSHTLVFLERQGPVLVAAYEMHVEGPGPTVELLVSEDDGATFDHRASVPKPTFGAVLDGLSLDGGALDLTTSDDTGGSLAAEYRGLRARLLGRVLPFAADEWQAPSTCTLRSRNLGRSFKLSCHPGTAATPY